jgi:hypothetical protein
MNRSLFSSALAAALAFAAITPVWADDSSRSGPFGLLDTRSTYGSGAFPEPFLVDDSDLEVNELRLDWERTGVGESHSDLITAEIEKGFGELTLELSVPYERDVSGGLVSEGAGSIDAGARYPLMQYVSADGGVDSTIGVGFEAGIPVHSSVSRNVELVPKVFNDLKLGNFMLQTVLGYSSLLGPAPDGGLDTFEYGFVFAYSIERTVLPVPNVQNLVPIFEISGSKELSNGAANQNILLGDAGLRINFKAIGSAQPRLGLAAVFPLDEAGRQQAHWGFITSLAIDY